MGHIGTMWFSPLMDLYNSLGPAKRAYFTIKMALFPLQGSLYGLTEPNLFQITAKWPAWFWNTDYMYIDLLLDSFMMIRGSKRHYFGPICSFGAMWRSQRTLEELKHIFGPNFLLSTWGLTNAECSSFAYPSHSHTMWLALHWMGNTASMFMCPFFLTVQFWNT